MRKALTHPKRVDQFKMDGTFLARFDSFMEAERATGVNNAGISMCCNGQRKQAGGYIWQLAQSEQIPRNNELSDLYDDIKAEVEKYCILKEGYSDVVTLWILGCYFISEISPFPRLVVTAPAKGCGKSQVLKVINALTNNSKLSANPTAAVLYRLKKDNHPIRLIDEVDQWLKKEREATDILNMGFEKGGVVERVDPVSNQPREHDVFMPIAMAGIQIEAQLDTTTLSRSIVLHVQKERGGEYANLPKMLKAYEPLREKALTVIEPMKKLYTPGTTPDHPEDRMTQVWESLYGIADMAGKLPEVNAAFDVINENYENDDMGILLLSLTCRYLGDKKAEKRTENNTGDEYVKTQAIFNLVTSDETYREADISINQNQYTAMIKGFNIRQKKGKFVSSSTAVSGLNVQDLRKAFDRYLS